MKTLFILLSLVSFQTFAMSEKKCIQNILSIAKNAESSMNDWGAKLIEYMAENGKLPGGNRILQKLLEVDQAEFDKAFNSVKTDVIVRNILEQSKVETLIDTKLEKLIATEINEFVADNLRLPSWTEIQYSLSVDNLFLDVIKDRVNLTELFIKHRPKAQQVLKNKLVQQYANLTKQTRRTPNAYEFAISLYGEELEPYQALNAFMRISGQMITPKTEIVLKSGKTSTIAKEAKRKKMSDEELDQYIFGLFQAYSSTDQVVDAVKEFFKATKVVKDEGAFRVADKGLVEIKNSARITKAHAFKDALDSDIFTAERTESFVKALHSKKLLVTTAVAGVPVEEDFYKLLLKYAKENEAQIIVIPANMQTHGLDSRLLNDPNIHVLTNSVELSDEWALSNIKIMPKMINPLAGLDDIDTRGMSTIVGAPRLVEKVIPTMDNKFKPHFLLSTGAITQNVYNTLHEIQERTAKLAEKRHKFAAVLLERDHKGDNQIGLPTQSMWHHRHLIYNPEEKHMYDNSVKGSKKISLKGTDTVRPAALIPGDIHVSETSLRILNAFREIIKNSNPHYIVLHDLLNGLAINHHEAQNLLSKATKYGKGELDLENELRAVGEFLEILLRENPKLKIVMVPSNHNDWLPQWLSKGIFIDDSINQHIGLELAPIYKRGEDPLEYALKEWCLPTTFHKRMVFLRPGESYKIAGVEVGQHGHSGANGGRGSIKTYNKSSDKLVYGHTHTIGREDDIVNNGTFTVTELGYSKQGASSWVNGMAAINGDLDKDNGQIQTLVGINGRFFKKRKVVSEMIIAPAHIEGPYPIIVPNSLNEEAATVGDQYKVR